MAYIEVLYFAALGELVARSEERVELPSHVVTVADLVRHLQLVHPALEGRLTSVRVALDEAFATDDEHLGSARVVALIPPVSGG